MQPIYVKNVKNTYFDCTIKKTNAKFFLIIVALRTMFPGTVARITGTNVLHTFAFFGRSAPKIPGKLSFAPPGTDGVDGEAA